MREEQQITALLVGVLVIGIAGLYFMGGIPGLAQDNVYSAKTYVNDYRGDLYLNGTFIEQFQYKSEGTFLGRIFRSWNYPLSFKKMSLPYVEQAGFVPVSGTLPYAKDHRGDLLALAEDGSEVTFPKELAYTQTINSLAEWDEAGCFNPSYFDAGREEVGYIFKIHPPIEQDSQNRHWNLLLADEHLPYENIAIRIYDPEGDIEQLFTYPAMATKKVGEIWVINGSSPKDGLIGVEMLLKANGARFLEGFPRNVYDVKGKAVRANSEALSEKAPVFGKNSSLVGQLGDIWVESYKADVYLNGTLREDFRYRILSSDKYRMLYRNWKTPLSAVPLNEPHVRPIKISPPAGSIAYVKDDINEARVLTTDGTYYPENVYKMWPFSRRIMDLAANNEQGYYIKGAIFKNTVNVSYRSVIHPHLQSDGNYSYLSLMLADKHPPYRHLSLTIPDPKGYVAGIFTSPRMDLSKEGSSWIITGAIFQDQPLEVHLLLKAEAEKLLQGFVQPVQDARGLFLQIDASFSSSNQLATAYSIAMRLLMLLAPLLLLAVYRRYGKERFFTVPKALSYVPNKRKPWQVNLVFKGDPFDFDKDGFYATILNLQRQNLVEIQSNESEGLRIKMLKGSEAAEDGYERGVAGFLRKNAREDVFDSKAFEEKIESLRKSAENDSKPAMNALHAIRDEMSDLMAGPSNATGHEFFMNHGRATVLHTVLPLALIAASGLIWVSYGDRYPQVNFGFISAIVFLIQWAFPAVVVPQAFFGRWKADYYREKLEWDAFKEFLSDYAMMEKYLPEDITIWKEWLVYATALGVGKKVVKAMEKFEIPAISEVQVVLYAPYHLDYAYFRTTEHVTTISERAAWESISSSGGSFHSHSGGGGGFGGGGGGGGGGGHGGGGGGAR